MRSMANPPACFSASSAFPRGFPSSILVSGRNVARPRLLRFRNWMQVDATSSLSTMMDCILAPAATFNATSYFGSTVANSAMVPWMPLISCLSRASRIARTARL